ncbi:PTS mannitol transporter subunit IIA [Candidatus Pantoea deserta]|uniref:PTS mannitol transporter subunit IIA n=1 Tax=Candidatus Pantoea deserta TaxID=1869313 RepID=A0A3N4P7X0_9GAMM|nr:PTS sugar transporter subunit IIA [Pantoea deserta]RPD99819.1 PTS mannitol transporter subunit IIA [Pantoea deserta]
MITAWLPAENIRIVESVSDWKHAIWLSAQPLLAKKAITENYIQSIFDSHQKLGPYYVLAPGLAMPHARPEQGAIKNGLSLLHIKQGVHFETDENDPVYVVIMLCALSGDEHIKMITALANIFSDDERLPELLKAATLEEIQTVINRE